MTGVYGRGALSAVIKLPEQAMVLTYASSDGDDHDMGQIRTNLRWKELSSEYYNQAHSYDNQDNSDEEPSPPPPSPPSVEMQTVMGADAETYNDQLRVHPYHNVAYCWRGAAAARCGARGPAVWRRARRTFAWPYRS